MKYFSAWRSVEERCMTIYRATKFYAGKNSKHLQMKKQKWPKKLKILSVGIENMWEKEKMLGTMFLKACLLSFVTNGHYVVKG